VTAGCELAEVDQALHAEQLDILNAVRSLRAHHEVVDPRLVRAGHRVDRSVLEQRVRDRQIQIQVARQLRVRDGACTQPIARIVQQRVQVWDQTVGLERLEDVVVRLM
jgi:hypothetical protein